jgi:hypothetical protein
MRVMGGGVLVRIGLAVGALAGAAVAIALAAAGTAAPDGATREVSIKDPVLNMEAFSMTIPSKWIFDGAVESGSACTDSPTPVVRLESPDGLYVIKTLPRIDWSWTDNGRPNQGGKDCTIFPGPKTAHDILMNMLPILQVEYVGDIPVPELAQAQRQAAQNDRPGFTNSIDKARVKVKFHINKIEMEGRVNVFISCHGLNGGHVCTAGISRTWAPAGKYDDSMFESISKTFQVNASWTQTREQIALKKLQQQADAGNAMLKGQADEANRRMRARYDSFQQSQQLHQKEHDDFLATMQRGTDMSMARTQDNMNARGRAADDWADYSLDQQKRLDPNTGIITKDSSAYNYTWVNEQGDRVQTNNINANPNGNGTGNWTLQENVR